MKKVSVVIPTYNRVFFLKKTIQSVIDQTYPNVEIIVVDDGSVDNTAALIDNFDEPITYIRQHHRGVCAARNNGIDKSTGDYILFLDSDDCLLPGNIETLVTLLNINENADVAYGWYYWIDKEGHAFQGNRTPQNVQTDPFWPYDFPPSGAIHKAVNGDIFEELCLDEFILLGTVLFSRRSVEAVGGFDLSIGHYEHWDFMLRVAKAGFRYACAKQPVALIRLHTSNRGQNHARMLAGRLQVISNVIDEKLSPELKTQAVYSTYLFYAKMYFEEKNMINGSKMINNAVQCMQMQAEDRAILCDKILRMAFADDISNPIILVKKLFSRTALQNNVKQLYRQVFSRTYRTLANKNFREKKMTLFLFHYSMAILYKPSLLVDFMGRMFGRINHGISHKNSVKD